MEIFASWVREQPDPIKESWECPKSRPAPCSSLLWSLSSLAPLPWQQKLARTCNINCFRNRYVAASVSTFPPLYHMCSGGKQHRIVPFLYGNGNVLQAGSMCNCTAGEKTEKKGSESQCVWGVFQGWSQRVKHIFVCRMNHQQGVAARWPPAPPARVSSSPSPTWRNSRNPSNHDADWMNTNTYFIKVELFVFFAV